MAPSHLRHTWLGTSLVADGHRLILARVYAVFVAVRFFLALHTIVFNLVFLLPLATSPVLVVFACLVMAAWTVFFSLHMRDPDNRHALDHAADVGVTVVVMMMTPFAFDGVVANNLAGFWVAGCALYAAIFMSTAQGALTAVIVGAVYLFMPPFTLTDRLDVVLMTLVGTVATGALTAQLRDAVDQQEQERVRSAALAERERLYRIVHDGALQVLALVEREGPTLGPRGQRLAVLARESETQLRTLLQDRTVQEPVDSPTVDLAAALDKFSSASVTVSTMAGQVWMERRMVDEVEATLVEALKNVEKHAGPDARAWVLLDQETDDEVILFVRDNGVGMTAESVSEAARRGRMGIQDSIVGRMAAIGGSAMLTSTQGSGTEWELRFPLEGDNG